MVWYGMALVWDIIACMSEWYGGKLAYRFSI